MVDVHFGGAYSSRPALVRRLVNFLKQYHLTGEDEVIRELLCDVAAEGTTPLDFGAWGRLRAREVREALATFEFWKSEQGRPFMPALYHSKHYNVKMSCVVARGYPDKSVDLWRVEKSGDVRGVVLKNTADPLLVVPRVVPDWFAPAPAGHAVLLSVAWY